MLLRLFIVAAASLVCASAAVAGEPVSGLDIAAQKAPSATMISAADCKANGGKIVRRNGTRYCVPRGQQGPHIEPKPGTPASTGGG
jgi:hypothetical protein